MSSIFLPRSIEAGSSTAIFGLMSVYLVDYIIHWNYYQKPGRKVLIWLFGTFLSLVIGLLPGIDNFAHIGGSIVGYFVAMALLPIQFRFERNKKLKWFCIRIFGIAMTIFYFALSLYVLYFQKDFNSKCKWCEYTSCIPVWNWCKKYDE
jgi:hypothetical protein